MVSDRDVTFTSAFWRELFRLSGTKLCFSSAYHPQSDGQTEVVNRTVEMYLRCFTSAHPTKWMDWLSWAEYSSNTSFHSSLKMIPFEVVYGRPPPRLLPYSPGISKLDAVDIALRTRDQILQSLRQNLLHAQQRMKATFDSKHRHVEFQVGDRVLLKLQPYKQLSMGARHHQKLLPKFYGPYKIEQRIGPVAYKLEFPPGIKLHLVFHVSKLKLFHERDFPAAATFPSSFPEAPLPHPITVLEHRVVRNVPEVLIHWQHTSPAEASWETVSSMQQRFPHFPLEDKRDLKGGSNVSTPLVYQRRKGVDSGSGSDNWQKYLNLSEENDSAASASPLLSSFFRGLLDMSPAPDVGEEVQQVSPTHSISQTDLWNSPSSSAPTPG
ncbi:hypothetical protein MTR67_023123 [Solanum verrucosum]|uniref:Integrase catalytic domain-containing protein n=1 Tax=Solanum verrucosum TaxID=315347 RepID=A0AAF0TYF2_SOLVR|nr:hypothetical protein MTR67_023123 [Solanum verrucosum]